jgi:hypothetical protein
LLRRSVTADNAAMENDSSDAGLPKRKRRWFQFSLRTLLIGVTVAALACGWLVRRVEQKRNEREAAEAIVKLGGFAFYDCEWTTQGLNFHNDHVDQHGCESCLARISSVSSSW